MFKIDGVPQISSNLIMNTSTSNNYSSKDKESKDEDFESIFQSELHKLNDSSGGTTMSKSNHFDYTECEHFVQEDVTPWHGDVFNHPSYETYCIKDGQKKQLLLPERQCLRCYERRLNEGKGC